MNLKRRIAGVGTIVVLLFVLTIFQLRAQTPTATPATETGTATPASSLPTTPFPPRQAVVKTPLDGDSVEVVFTDNGQIATVHLANVRAPESVGDIECFGREAAEYAVQSYQSNPLITIEPVGEFENDGVSAYVTLADGTLLNEMLVLFGYAHFDGQVQSTYTEVGPKKLDHALRCIMERITEPVEGQNDVQERQLSLSSLQSVCPSSVGKY